jgi:tyrosyl-tRNA synthetase
VKADKEKIKKLLTEGGVEEVIGREDLQKKLLSGRKLIVKFGADPTRPDLHLGHAVPLGKLREFQDLGHKVVFLIGDATTKIGDPTGKDKTRPVMTDKEIKKNAQTYIRQASKILKTDKGLLEIRRNSEWFGKMKFYDFLRLMTMTTTARVLERDMFQKRMTEGRDVGLHELVYPIMQGYDSVEIKADVVLLGSDQKFNELFGRHYQEKFGQQPQAMIITRLLVGTDGTEKMSKSLDNYIGLTESADQMYGKVMSIPDSAIAEYYKLASGLSQDRIKNSLRKIKQEGYHPMSVKADVAFEIVRLYHGKNQAVMARENFVNIFQRKKNPKNIQKYDIPKNKIKLTEYMGYSGSAYSLSDARRKIEQGGVSIDGKKIEDYKFELNKKEHNNKVVKVGKLHFSKIIFK